MYDINSNILSKSGVDVGQLETAIAAIRPDNGFASPAMFLAAEAQYGINALFIAAHAAVESAWGTSNYAKTRNNLFGFNAVDSDPDEASSYPSQEASVDFYANFLKTYYLTPGAKYYNGDTPHGVFVDYSSSHDAEAETVVSIMNLILEKIDGEVPAPSAGTNVPAAPVATATYPVKSGENLTEISAKYAGTTIAGWVAANKSKYPQITSDFIEAGWNLVIPAAAEAAPSDPAPSEPEPEYREVAEGDTLSAYEAEGDASPAQIVEWNKGAYPRITEDFIEAGWRLRVK